MSRYPRMFLLSFVPALLLVNCKPEYPKCDNDQNCKEGEYCVNGLCQQCRSNEDCGKGKTCKDGRCEAVPGYCDTLDDCPDKQACINKHCAACKSDADCGPGNRCKNGKCLKPGQCLGDDDCPEGNECQNGNCVAPPREAAKGPCQPETIYFDFNEFVLTSEATAKLQENVKCIKSVSPRRLRLEGHADPRGTEEYNLALGDRRAQSVKKYLNNLAIDGNRLRTVSKGKLEAKGTDEGSWALDRKVQFIWE